MSIAIGRPSVYISGGGSTPPTPFEDAFSGGLGGDWYGPTWSVAGGVATNTPSVSAEILSDPGLEGTYTAGLAAVLTKGGSPTLAQSADVHGGSKAQAFEATALNDALYRTYAGASHDPAKFYRWSVWAKRTAGASAGAIGIKAWQPSIGKDFGKYITSATYKEHVLMFRSGGAAQPFYLYPVTQTSATLEAAVVDDVSLKTYTTADLFATRDFGAANATVRVKIAAIDGEKTGFPEALGILGGLVLNLDSISNPQNYVIAWISKSAITLEKCVAGVFTTLINASAITWGASKYLQVIKSGTTYQLYYDGAQIGTDQTISDAGIVNNTRHGMFGMEATSFDDFFISA